MDNIFEASTKLHIKKESLKVSYTFHAPCLEVAALVCNVLSNVCVPCACNFSIDTFDNESMLFYEWYIEMFKKTPHEGMKMFKAELAKALKTLLPGDMNDRAKYELALKYIPDEDKAAFSEIWKKEFAIDTKDTMIIHNQRMNYIKQKIESL